VTIVYTTIFGGSDSLKPAPKGADRCVCFVDDPYFYADALGWELVKGSGPFDPRRNAWWMRCVAHKLFPKADRTVWIDASFTLTDLPRLLKDAGSAQIAGLRHHARRSAYQEGLELIKIGQANRDDITAQLTAYKAANYPKMPLSISCVLVRSNSERVQRFNETWDAEIRRWPGDNTQVSLDYAAWTHGLTIAHLRGRRHHNPYATHDHSDHKLRRKPYLKAVAA
jgi:hypothetical protein